MALKLMNDGTTDISASADGALYNFKTNGGYVFRGIGSEFAATYSNTARLVTIGNGEGVCGGRHVTEKKIGNSNSQITLPTNSSGYLTIRMEPGADPDCYLWAGSELRHDDLNNGGTIRDLPLYAYVTSSTGITSFIDIRPLSVGNGFVLRLEADGEVYADYTVNDIKRHRKIKTKAVEYLDQDAKLFLRCVDGLAFDDNQGQEYYRVLFNTMNVDGGTEVTAEQKSAILDCLTNAVWAASDAANRYNALLSAWGE